MNSFFSIRSLERAAKRMPDGLAKQNLVRDVTALRQATAALRETQALIKSEGP
jgi:hypothetical protein